MARRGSSSRRLGHAVPCPSLCTEKYKILLTSMVVSFLYLYRSSSSVILSSVTVKPSHLAKADDSSRNSNEDQGPIQCSGTSCTDTVGIQGKWVDVGSNRSFAAPVCCTWDRGLVFRNGAQCGKKPATDQLYSGNQDNSYQSLGGHGCSCTKFNDKYEWQSPTLPPASSFDPIATCRLLGGRKVLMIGDSTNQQTGTILINSLVPGRCQTQITVATSDTLVGVNYGVLNRGMKWDEYTKKFQPDIVIVSVGAHINRPNDTENEETYTAVIDQVIDGMLAYQRDIDNNVTFAWKTQQPGGCTRDILFPDNPAAFSWSNISHYIEFEHNHRRFYHRDLLLLSRLQKIGMPYLDMRMLYSRSDAHVNSLDDRKKDCLHLCAPGPLDVVGRLFHNLLIEIDSRDDSTITNAEPTKNLTSHTQDQDVIVGTTNDRTKHQDDVSSPYFTFCNKRIYLNNTPFLIQNSDYTNFGFARWNRNVSNSVVIDKSRYYGRTGNQIREWFHAFDLARDRDAALLIHDDGFPIDNPLRKLFLGFDKSDPNWKQRIENIFGVTVVDEGDESHTNSTQINAKELFFYKSKDHDQKVEQRKSHRHYVIQKLYRLAAEEMELNPNSSSTNDMCSSLFAFFDENGEGRKTNISSDGTNRQITSKYTVIHSRSFEKHKYAYLEKAQERFGVDGRASMDFPEDLITSILTPLGMQNNSILMITDGQNEEVIQRLSSDVVIGPLFHVVPPSLSTVKSDMVRL
ncbi:predicted protein [Thalassiosira pseudonana CCMP1335]|uniref:Uncharacterized protein n=1 Tax=Thalassiosira pseudonana TaxID=35128 RepID=B5YP55_THAPS|nr:predicted protein [Thalassiosira pseudonana CCMP1335]ACI64742.1 predicted protein [Thalassiosira pseudonana CCMP1335]